MFPGGLGYDKQNDRVQTPKENAIFSAIHSLSGEIENIKKGEPIPVNQFSDLVSPIGFEPMTASLEGRCSIQLSYEPVVLLFLRKQCGSGRKIPYKNSTFYYVGVAGFEPATSSSQTRRDDRATLHPEYQFLRRVWDSNPRDSYPSTV